MLNDLTSEHALSLKLFFLLQFSFGFSLSKCETEELEKYTISVMYSMQRIIYNRCQAQENMQKAPIVKPTEVHEFSRGSVRFYGESVICKQHFGAVYTVTVTVSLLTSIKQIFRQTQ